MRIITDKEEEVWTVQEIGDFEWFLLAELPRTADVTDSSKARDRLFPDAVSPEEHAEAAADWRQYVRPEIEDRFSQNLTTVRHALEKAEETTTDEGDLLRTMRIPLDEAETWYLVLNQARLVLNEEKGIARLEQTLEEDGPEGFDETLALPMAQYEFYTAIQSYLIARIMDRG